MQIVHNEPNLSLFQITVVIAEYDFHGQGLEGSLFSTVSQDNYNSYN